SADRISRHRRAQPPHRDRPRIPTWQNDWWDCCGLRVRTSWVNLRNGPHQTIRAPTGSATLSRGTVALPETNLPAPRKSIRLGPHHALGAGLAAERANAGLARRKRNAAN